MRNFITVLFYLLLILSSVCAQESPQEDYSIKSNSTLKLGVKGGLNIATISTNNGEIWFINTPVNTNSISGLILGAFLNIPLGEYISIQPEMFYTTKGVAVEFPAGQCVGNEPCGLDLRLRYIQVPVCIKLHLPISISIINPNLFLGPSYSFLIVAEDLNSNSSIKESTSKSDLGIVFGLGLNIGSIILEGRYDLGIANVFEDFKGNKNRTITIMGGFSF